MDVSNLLAITLKNKENKASQKGHTKKKKKKKKNVYMYINKVQNSSLGLASFEMIDNVD